MCAPLISNSRLHAPIAPVLKETHYGGSQIFVYRNFSDQPHIDSLQTHVDSSGEAEKYSVRGEVAVDILANGNFHL